MIVKESFNNILDKAGDLSNYSVLDIFAREGDWQSYRLNGKVKSLEAWEINEEFIPNLKKNLPDASVYCRDSIQFINNNDYNKFNLLVIDNGLNCYGANKEYCEHFDFINNIKNVVTQNSFVIFNVCRKPFNYSNYPEWIKRRNEFYQLEDSSELTLEFIESFYKELFNKSGFQVSEYYTECREYHNDIDYLYYIGVRLI
jgi:hypothetical protein